MQPQEVDSNEQVDYLDAHCHLFLSRHFFAHQISISLGDQGVYQVKRIFLFIPLSVFIPSFCATVVYLLLAQLEIDSFDTAYLIFSYTVVGISSFLVFWFFARGLNSKPYSHGFIVYLLSALILNGFLSVVTKQIYISSTLYFDLIISVLAMLIAIKLGYRDKDVSSEVS